MSGEKFLTYNVGHNGKFICYLLSTNVCIMYFINVKLIKNINSG